MSLATVLVVVAIFGIVWQHRSAEARMPFDPASVPGTQVVWVTAPAGSDRGTLELWQRGPRWERTLSVTAWVGAEGISSRASEGSAFSPEGTFALTEGFGRVPDVDSEIPYLAIDPSNTWWWVSDTESPWYNQKYRCAEAECPFDTTVSENLGRTDPHYNYALVIDYNRFPVIPKRGSAFFVHVESGGATAGCVAVTADAMRTLLATLQPSRKPVIGIYAS